MSRSHRDVVVIHGGLQGIADIDTEPSFDFTELAKASQAAAKEVPPDNCPSFTASANVHDCGFLELGSQFVPAVDAIICDSVVSSGRQVAAFREQRLIMSRMAA